VLVLVFLKVFGIPIRKVNCIAEHYVVTLYTKSTRHLKSVFCQLSGYCEFEDDIHGCPRYLVLVLNRCPHQRPGEHGLLNPQTLLYVPHLFEGVRWMADRF